MDAYYLHSLPGSQASENSCPRAAQSMEEHSTLYAPQEATSQHLPTMFGQSYPLFLHRGHGSSLAPQISQADFRPSFLPPAPCKFNRATSASNHSYYNADHASVQYQGWVQPPYPAVSAHIAAVSGTFMPYDATIGNCASTRRQTPSQSSPAANKHAPDESFDLSSQVNIPVSNADESVPSSMSNFPTSSQTVPLTQRRAPSPSHPPVDPQDIEYAQHRYGNKRCFYRCRFDLSGSPCNKWIVGDRTRVLRHLRSHHNLQTGPASPELCLWEKCTHSRPMKHENLSRHVVMHLGVKWKCPHCRRLFSRDDAVHRHMERMAPGMEVSEAEVVAGREAFAITDSRLKRARMV